MQAAATIRANIRRVRPNATSHFDFDSLSIGNTYQGHSVSGLPSFQHVNDIINSPKPLGDIGGKEPTTGSQSGRRQDAAEPEVPSWILA
jgi:hypothetical protein